MKTILTAMFAAALVSGCVGGSANSTSGDAVGGAGMDVEVYKSGNSVYFEAGSGGSRQHRQQYRNSVAMYCGTPQGSCPMAVGIPKGAPCYCPSQWGPVWGQSY